MPTLEKGWAPASRYPCMDSFHADAAHANGASGRESLAARTRRPLRMPTNAAKGGVREPPRAQKRGWPRARAIARHLLTGSVLAPGDASTWTTCLWV